MAPQEKLPKTEDPKRKEAEKTVKQAITMLVDSALFSFNDNLNSINKNPVTALREALYFVNLEAKENKDSENSLYKYLSEKIYFDLREPGSENIEKKCKSVERFLINEAGNLLKEIQDNSTRDLNLFNEKEGRIFFGLSEINIDTPQAIKTLKGALKMRLSIAPQKNSKNKISDKEKITPKELAEKYYLVKNTLKSRWKTAENLNMSISEAGKIEEQWIRNKDGSIIRNPDSIFIARS